MDVHMRRLSAQDLLVCVAGGALLLAMVVDTLAMLGRQLRLPLPGAIELVQAAVLFAACGSLIVTTRAAAHARVHLLLDRATGRIRAVMQFINAVASGLVFLVLLAGSLWIAADLWDAQEESEIWHLPYRPLRITVVLTSAWLLLLALRATLRPGQSR
jgi:TRAP-type C4-dicarboxylate transport system permease small subunit